MYLGNAKKIIGIIMPISMTIISTLRFVNIFDKVGRVWAVSFNIQKSVQASKPASESLYNHEMMITI